MSMKWYKFKKRYDAAEVSSSIKMAQISAGANRILVDWNRMSGVTATIDGKNLADLVEDHKGRKLGPHEAWFEDEDDLKNFFRNNLLKKVKEENKDEALKQTFKIMHQGGLQSPVTAALHVSIVEASKGELGLNQHTKGREEREEGEEVRKEDNQQIREVNFITTSKGFKVQEILTQKSLINLADPETPINPDDGFDYALKARATIDIDFSKNQSRPTATIESNTISFGYKKAEQYLSSNKDWLEKFIDKLCNAVGWHRKEQATLKSEDSQRTQDDEKGDEEGRRLIGGP